MAKPGNRGGLKIRWPYGLVGSNPTPGTMNQGLDHIGVSIVFCCHDGDGRFILAKRSDKCRDEMSRWDVGSGVLHHGETVENALRREVKEEYCTDSKEIISLGYRDVRRHDHNGQQTHWIGLDHLVLVDSSQVAIGESEKIDALE